MEALEPAPEPTMLDKLRNMWEFSNFMQYIYIFGRAVKIDEDLTIEVLLPKINLRFPDQFFGVFMLFETSCADDGSVLGSRERMPQA